MDFLFCDQNTDFYFPEGKMTLFLAYFYNKDMLFHDFDKFGVLGNSPKTSPQCKIYEKYTFLDHFVSKIGKNWQK